MAATPGAARYNLRSRNPPAAPVNQADDCPICLLPVPRNLDYVRCANRCAAYFHRDCFETWCGRPCLCKGLLCDTHPDGNGVPPDYLTHNCPHCNGPAYPTLDETEKRWRAVFDTFWFQRYVSRYDGGWYQLDPRAYNQTRMLLTTDRNFGNRDVNHWLDEYVNNQRRTMRQAQGRIWRRYRDRRTRLHDKNGTRLPPRLISYIWKDWYLDLITDFYNTDLYIKGGMPRFRNAFAFDRVLYWYDHNPIAAGQPQYRLLPSYRPPFGADVYARDCGFSRINLLIHNQRSEPWARFRRMFERPENEWPASW